MASASRDKNRNGWRVQLYTHTGKRVSFWLGSVSKQQAESVAKKLELLKIARTVGEEPTTELARWTDRVSDRLRSLLIDHDLISCEKKNIPKTVGDFTRWYIDSQKWKPRTHFNFENTRSHLVRLLGESTELKKVTSGDSQRAARSLYESFAPSHAGKLVSRFRQFFAAAIADRLIDSNPFHGIKIATSIKQNRKCYVDESTVDVLIDKAPNSLFKFIIAAARYCGLRVPSEILALRWDDIDWESSRMTIRSSKNESYESGVRVIPLFPKVRICLERLFEEAEEGSIDVCPLYRSGNGSPIRNQLLRICKTASVEPWPKLWVNLRASCRTDLERKFPDHVCNVWLGHSGKIADKHYSRVTEDDFNAAIAKPGPSNVLTDNILK
jgi:integrase